MARQCYLSKVKQIFFFCFLTIGYNYAQENCYDGLDNDDDGFIDCYDTDCYSDSACTGFIIQEIKDNSCLDSSIPTFGMKRLWESYFPGITQEQTFVIGDIDQDGIPEVIAAGVSGDKQVKIFDGATGVLKNTITITGSSSINRTGIALADVDADGYGEIFIYLSTEIRCYEHDATLKWTTGTGALASWATGRSLSLADFNQDGKAECYFMAQYGQILDAETGNKLISFTPGIGRTKTPIAADVLPASACADCDGLEFITGPEVYAININAGTATLVASAPSTLSTTLDDYVSIADLNGDQELDILVNGWDTLYAWDPRTGLQIGQVFSSKDIFITSTYRGHGGLPNIGNFDNDPEPEIAMEINDYFIVLEHDLSLKWNRPINDISSAITASSSFNFDCDDAMEIVFRDHTFLYIIDGNTGDILAQVNSSNGTSREHPTIVDVNGDGSAEIVMMHQDDLVAWESDNIPWAPTRKVMNQHSYFGVNINDDLTVPKMQQNHAKLANGNTFLAQPNFSDQNGKCYTVVPYECDTLLVNTILEDSSYFVPNGFSPNSNGVNDIFEITLIEVSTFQLRIYNRMGILLFESSIKGDNWDGTYKNITVKNDVYLYTIRGVYNNGQKFNALGNLTLVR